MSDLEAPILGKATNINTKVVESVGSIDLTADYADFRIYNHGDNYQEWDTGGTDGYQTAFSLTPAASHKILIHSISWCLGTGAFDILIGATDTGEDLGSGRISVNDGDTYYRTLQGMATAVFPKPLVIDAGETVSFKTTYTHKGGSGSSGSYKSDQVVVSYSEVAV